MISCSGISVDRGSIFSIPQRLQSTKTSSYIHPEKKIKMSGIDKKFEKATEIVKTLPSDGEDKPSQDEQLEFYALFKQATVGDVNSARPGMMDFTGKYKWDAWEKKKGMASEEAKTKYVQLLKTKLEKSSDQEQAKKLLEQLESA
ncbi:hypothetical protein KEM48_011523 [Puccinia striiformis f. sp. tritici PST-130]|nr:hypothetical protein KEM48_011523 [Puccinia striiformis f. sp. tritici PST-130]